MGRRNRLFPEGHQPICACPFNDRVANRLNLGLPSADHLARFENEPELMTVVVLHSEVLEGAGPDEEDVLVQVQAVQNALTALGHVAPALVFSLDVQGTIGRLMKLQPSLVFNLVETLRGSGRLIHVAPSILDHLGIPYTGARTESIFLTSNKLLAKKMLQASGIATPRWVTPASGETPEAATGPFIVKSVWEHASVGLDEDCIVFPRGISELGQAVVAQGTKLGGDCFAEIYVDGREFNLSMLAGENGPAVLPPAEITFDGFPDGNPRIVGYRAKWNEDSFEFNNTPRRFEFEKEDYGLLQKLREIALECWRVFDLRGYARVDFRVDQDGKPWVLEVNANPCLSPDAGFMAAANRAGLKSTGVIKRILDDGLSFPPFMALGENRG